MIRSDCFDFRKFIDTDSLGDEICFEFLAVLCWIDRITIGISDSSSIAVCCIMGEELFAIDKLCIISILLAYVFFTTDFM